MMKRELKKVARDMQGNMNESAKTSELSLGENEWRKPVRVFLQ